MSTALRLSIDDYETMIANGAFVGIQKRLEFIHGEIRQMTPAGPYHYDYIDFLTRWSTLSLTRDEGNVQIQSAILIDDSMPEPDVMWLQPRRYGGQRPTAKDALLIVEVADSSLSYDLGEKADLYAAAWISDYWVVDVKHRQVHQHRQPDAAGYSDVSIHTAADVLSPLCKPSVELRLEELFGGE